MGCGCKSNKIKNIKIKLKPANRKPRPQNKTQY